jgi:hypothetical protein
MALGVQSFMNASGVKSSGADNFSDPTLGSSGIADIRNVVGKLAGQIGRSVGLETTLSGATQSVLGRTASASPSATSKASSESVASTESVTKALASLGVQTSSINMVA